MIVASPAALKLTVSPLPGTVFGFQLLLFPQSELAAPVHVASSARATRICSNSAVTTAVRPSHTAADGRGVLSLFRVRSAMPCFSISGRIVIFDYDQGLSHGG